MKKKSTVPDAIVDLVQELNTIATEKSDEGYCAEKNAAKRAVRIIQGLYDERIPLEKSILDRRAAR